MRRNLIGVVDKIRPLTTFPDMLIRFSLVIGEETVNCICGDRNIGNSLLFLEDGKTEVALYGTYNSRKQLVVKKLIIRNPTEFERVYAMQGVL